MSRKLYTTQLQAGLGMIQETLMLLKLWEPQLELNEFYRKALISGLLPNISARRLRNIIVECFSPRYLSTQPPSALFLKRLQEKISNKTITQLFYVYTCRANSILYDFINEVYWPAYSSGKGSLSNEESERFVVQAVQDDKTYRPWSESTIRRMSGYLTGCCADFGLLEPGPISNRKILSINIELTTLVYFAHELHFSGLGDNNILSHSDWTLFGLERSDVLNEFKQLALKSWMIIQSAGDITRIGWQYQNMEDVINALIKR